MGFIVFIIYLAFFLFFQTHTLYGGDAGDLVAAAFTGGFAHAPGYPLYSMIGYVLTKIPFAPSPAWSVTLLSSIPAAATLTILYLFIKKLTNSTIGALLSSSTLMMTYIFWLYAIVPEVFVLELFFAISIFYLLYLWSLKGNTKLFFTSIFLFSLSLTHHHIILFMVPAFAYNIFTHKKLLPKRTSKNVLYLAVTVLIGFLPYLWLPFTAAIVSVHTWGDPVTPVRLVKVIVRAYYGTFIATQNYNQTISTRLNQIPMLIRFYADDFLVPTLLISIIGVYGMLKKYRTVFWYVMLGFLFTGPLFFIYASYDYSTPYRTAVAERFLLPSYLMLAIIFGIGVAFTENLITKKLKNVRKSILFLIIFSLFIIPLHIGLYNYYKLSILKNDQTAENFAQDILGSSTHGKKAIFLLQNDNSIFNAQYLHQWQKTTYANRIPLNPAELFQGFQNKMIHKYYPDIILPSSTKYHPIADFILKNYDTFEIYADLHNNYDDLAGIKDGKWIPYGLVFRYYKKGDVPPSSELVKRNDELWKDYHNPLEGSLKYYRNLQLAHVLEFYQFGQIRSGVFALESGFYQNALDHFKEFEKLKPEADVKVVEISSAVAYIGLNKCSSAAPIVASVNNYNSREYYKLMILYSEACKKDKSAVKVWKKRFSDFEKKKARNLQEL